MAMDGARLMEQVIWDCGVGGVNECVRKALRGLNFVGFLFFKIVCPNAYSGILHTKKKKAAHASLPTTGVLAAAHPLQ